VEHATLSFMQSVLVSSTPRCTGISLERWHIHMSFLKVKRPERLVVRYHWPNFQGKVPRPQDLPLEILLTIIDHREETIPRRITNAETLALSSKSPSSHRFFVGNAVWISRVDFEGITYLAVLTNEQGGYGAMQLEQMC
jgi:uncharacterized protein YndB with AHSA1/START domain